MIEVEELRFIIKTDRKHETKRFVPYLFLFCLYSWQDHKHAVGYI